MAQTVSHNNKGAGYKAGDAADRTLTTLPWRLWQYLKERFPLEQHGVLVASFTLAGMCLSSALRGAPQLPSITSYLVCLLTTLTLFLCLRIADEFKDREDDAKYRPYLPVPRGLVCLRELAAVFAGCILVQIILNAHAAPQLLVPLGFTWIYLVLMSKEFFAGGWLRRHPVIYLFSHMAILPFIDFYITACDWMVNGSAAPPALAIFIGVSFLNGIILELGRKIRHREKEEPGVETYSSIWGIDRSLSIWLLTVNTTGLATLALSLTLGYTALSITAIALTAIATACGALAPAAGVKAGKVLEQTSGLYVLFNYLALGVVPQASFWS